MKLKIEDNVITIFLSGDIDEFAVRTLKNEVDDVIDKHKGIKALVLDMSGVNFVDSTGLGFIFGRYKRLQNIHAELLLFGVNKQVDRVFRTSGVYKFVPLVE